MRTRKMSAKKPLVISKTGMFRHASFWRKLGYTFTNDSLVDIALTHRSFDASTNYERLEFLGDALLGMIIAEALYQQYPEEKEGRLTRMRATLVRQETLAKIAADLGLSDYLILGVGELKGGGRKRASILADTVESLIAAIYLDSQSVDMVKNCVLTWFEPYIASVNTQKVLKDAKSRLQEWLQAHKHSLPNYTLVSVVGNAPDEVFTVSCEVAMVTGTTKTGVKKTVTRHQASHSTSPTMTQATGSSRRIAEQQAAMQMLQQLNIEKS